MHPKQPSGLTAWWAWALAHSKERYGTAVRIIGWLMLAWEVVVDRFHNLGVVTAAVGMILYKTVAASKNGNGKG